MFLTDSSVHRQVLCESRSRSVRSPHPIRYRRLLSRSELAPAAESAAARQTIVPQSHNTHYWSTGAPEHRGMFSQHALVAAGRPQLAAVGGTCVEGAARSRAGCFRCGRVRLQQHHRGDHLMACAAGARRQYTGWSRIAEIKPNCPIKTIRAWEIHKLLKISGCRTRYSTIQR